MHANRNSAPLNRNDVLDSDQISTNSEASPNEDRGSEVTEKFYACSKNIPPKLCPLLFAFSILHFRGIHTAGNV